MRFSGVWLPAITPFTQGEIDFPAYERLIDHYLKLGVAGIIPLGTTGESPTIDDDEAERLVERTVATVAGRVPIVVGVGSNDTRKAVKAVKRLQRHPVQGILSVCPYYNRPSQDGMREHFTRIAEATDRPILIYNIPYRTGVNLTNETLLRLAEIPNIAGVKDSSGSVPQSLELLRQRPDGFAVLTGEDAYFYTMLAHGGDGGILASAHVETALFLTVYERMAADDPGNLLLLKQDGGASFDAYAELLPSLLIIRIIEIGLFAVFFLHIFSGTVLWFQNRAARPERYNVNKPQENSSLFSRTMFLTGSIVFIFLVVHIKTFWVASRYYHDEYPSMYKIAVTAFADPLYSLFYVLAVALLAFHLRHGFAHLQLGPVGGRPAPSAADRRP